ncbi:D-Ala-D-Ala carboxypeptidase family metallohydrolase [Pseudanabaena sp. Chao 1811]|uniref:D-Ala-D-Ala carboxypeptidase family metallohydrolase n=1 Tax=Pseudanabaena sp. Chao 1811 TaxID=2963092 RepID=UPI0022F3F381|nr:D-Ala-D-Ala carboxypeptidase family metallohydrolase [Pseudanabaena sp. Chao 1811]
MSTTWIKLNAKALYLMKGGTNEFIEKVDLVPKLELLTGATVPTPIAGKFSLNIPARWFERSDAPGQMAINLTDTSEPSAFKTTTTPTAATPSTFSKITAPSGEEFAFIDSRSAGTSEPNLANFQPNQALNDGTLLPRYYFKVNDFKDFSKKLTTNFTLLEFISDTEIARGITFPYYIPVAIIRLADSMQSLRDRFGEPIRVSSGYRSPFYPDYQNNPSFKSAHRFGTAIDFVSVGDRIIDSQADLDFVDDKVFDGGFLGGGNRPSGSSSLGFEFTESAAEMGFDIHHSHLDMGYITQNAELIHVKDFL